MAKINPIKVLLVEDNPGDARLVQEALRNAATIELVRADVPPGLRALIMRCLAKDPGERPRHPDVVEGGGERR